MIRLFLTAAFVTALGFFIIVNFAPEQANNLVIFVGSILLFSGIVKIVLDIYVHRSESELEEENYDKVGPDSNVKTYYDLEEYNKASERKAKLKRKWWRRHR